MKTKRKVIILILSLLVSLFTIPSKEAQAAQNVKIGDYVQFGSYLNDPILWRVINIDKVGDPLLFSEHIISYKSFDFPEGNHSNNQDRSMVGSNKWENSNIREWLNSSDKSVRWSTTPPAKTAFEWNGMLYANEAGFLTNFLPEERKQIKPIQHKTLLSEVDKHEKDGGKEGYKSAVFPPGQGHRYGFPRQECIYCYAYCLR